jgi:hypothetical protein
MPVNLSFSGTAVAGTDYQTPPASAVIPAGQNSVTIPIAPIWATNQQSVKSVIVTVQPGPDYDVSPSDTASAQLENSGPAPHFRTSATTRTPDGAVHLVIDSPMAASFQVQASNDLVNWSLLTTVTNSPGTARVDDPSAAAQARRFYRAKSF